MNGIFRQEAIAFPKLSPTERQTISPGPAGAAIALSLFTGMAGSTNEVTISLSLKDCRTKSLIWKYDHKYSGGVLSSPTSLVENLMRDSSRKMPYFR